MTNTLTTTAFTHDWSVLWWLLVPFLLGLVILAIGIARESEDTTYSGLCIMIFVPLFLAIIIAPEDDFDRARQDVVKQLNYSEVQYSSDTQFTAKDDEGYFVKCALLGSENRSDTYEVVCSK